MSAIDDGGDPYYAGGLAAVEGVRYSYSESDSREAQKMARFQIGDPNVPWWQNLAMYGVSKAIDNTFPNEQRGMAGNTHPGSFGGTNGRSYNQRGANTNQPPQAMGATVGGIVGDVANLSPVVLALGALIVYFLVKK